MEISELQARLDALEAEAARLRRKVEGDPRPWWEQVAGSFADDPMFVEAMRLGRKHRESLRPAR